MTDATITAEKLLQAKAVRLNAQEPFTWASGWKSPIYCDNRKLLSVPFTREYIKSELCNVIFEKFADATVIAGVATAGIAWGAMVADQLKLPFIYVRPKPKEHGLGNQIEGDLPKGAQVVILEDLVSTGKSSLQVAKVLRQQGASVLGMVSIFNYGFEAARQAFETAAVPLLSLTNYPSLLHRAIEIGLINPAQREVLLKWSANPAEWTGVH